MGKKKWPKSLDEVEPQDMLKYEIAEELGLLPKVLEEGFSALTSKETGRIGGLMTKKRRELDARLSSIFENVPK